MKEKHDTIRRMFEGVSLGAPENATGFIFWRITARYQREMDRALSSIDLTHLQFVTLALAGWLARSGESVVQSDLARFGGIHPMQLSQMLKVLEDKALVSRQRSTLDGRAKQVAITKSGLQALRQALPLAIEVQERLFGERGRPGGSLHEMLLAVDRSFEAMEEPPVQPFL